MLNHLLILVLALNATMARETIEKPPRRRPDRETRAADRTAREEIRRRPEVTKRPRPPKFEKPLRIEDAARFGAAAGIPRRFLLKDTMKSGEPTGGFSYVNPDRKADEEVRYMPGNPRGNEAQREPYVVHRRGNRVLDVRGNLIARGTPASHIPVTLYRYHP